MNATNDGWPAFPIPIDDDYRCNARFVNGYGGMSLRDWFAGMALQGWISSYGSSDAHPVSNDTQHSVAELSYKMADAMLAARDRKGGA